MQELLAALVIVLRCAEQVIGEIVAGYAAVEREVSVRCARIALIDLQVAELTPKLDRVSASRFRESIRDVPGVVRLKRRQRIHAQGEVVEVYRWHGLWKSRRSRGYDAESSWASNETEIREFCEAATWLVRMRSCPEETQTKLIHSGCTIIFVVIEDELLCTAYRSTGKTWHTGIQSVKIVGVVEVIIKRPVAGHLVNEVYS